MIQIVAVGKLREAFYRAAVDEYVSRIRFMLPCEETEVSPGTGEEFNGKGNRAIAKEGEMIVRHLSPNSVTVAMDVSGKPMSTEEFAQWISEQMNRSVQRLNFVVGGAWGLSPSVLGRADLRLSLSKMTLPHELARLVLVEQIYRALTLWKGHPYHKS